MNYYSIYYGYSSIGLCSCETVPCYGHCVGLHCMTSCMQIGVTDIAEPMHNLPVVNLFMHLLGNNRSCWGKRWIEVHRKGHPIYWFIKYFLLKSLFLVIIHVQYKYLQISCVSGEIYPHNFSPDLFVNNFPIVFLLLILFCFVLLLFYFQC